MASKAEYRLPVVNIRLVRDNPLPSPKEISGVNDAVDVIMDLLSECDREMFCLLNLRNDGSVINMHVASIGTLSASLVSPKDIFKASILSNAAAVLFFHNHPSGRAMPSRDDYETTQRLVESGKVLDIKVLDHIIVGALNGSYYSFREHGEMEKSYADIRRDRNVAER